MMMWRHDKYLIVIINMTHMDYVLFTLGHKPTTATLLHDVIEKACHSKKKKSKCGSVL